jgi:transposase
MPKKAHLAKFYSSKELKDKSRKSTDSVEARRWHLLWKVSLGWTIKHSAVAVGLSYPYAKSLIKRYNELGEAGVKNQNKKPKTHPRGKKSLLSEQQLQKLIQQIQQKPPDGGIWTGTKVARWIEKETKIAKVWNQRGWDYLKKCKYSWQSPRPKHKKGKFEEQAQFKQNLPLLVEQLQKQHPNSEIEVWFFDEHRVGLKPILRKVWSPIGTRPTAVVQHRYEWLYVYGFVEPKSGKTLWYLIPSVNIQWMNVVLKNFASETVADGKKIILLVQDRAGWHRSQKVNLPQGIVALIFTALLSRITTSRTLMDFSG